MSHTHPTSTSSNFKLIFDNALKAYKKRTRNDLLTHPLANRLEACDSASSILTVLQGQVQELNQSQRSSAKWLDPTVYVLHAFSDMLGGGVGSVGLGHELVRDLRSHVCLKIFTPAKVIFIGLSVPLSVCPLNTFVRFVIKQTIPRQRRRFVRTKTLFLRCSSAWKHFSDAWTYTLKWRQIREWWT